MTQYLIANGGDRSATSTRCCIGWPSALRSGFRDVVFGGNAVDTAGPGYDLVTGLGTPDIDNMVRNLLILQKATR